ncbi:protein FAR1-RELATED SEQUENCE 5-like [Arachis hypogaea]|uniref:protein FAR1-RELATED SEQUENCE 5-like n=1 Tax=Arachis hypogaea TaxID=3818 RepID=UPI000DED051B|nr:protein FAR1-RELATED SEQUENCE 5-like [Arachis hypogaea]
MASCSRVVNKMGSGSSEDPNSDGEMPRMVGDDEEKMVDIGMEEDEFEGFRYNQSEGIANTKFDAVPVTASDVRKMEFNSPVEATIFYEEYSRAKGFVMRQGKKLKIKNGDFVRYTYLCNRQGFRDKKWLEKVDCKREHKVVTRCGCPAEMRIKPKGDSGRWYVSRFVEEHNHKLLPMKYVDYLPAHRKISDVDIAHMESMRQVGISIPKIYESIAAQAGGFNFVPFTKRDMYNEVRRQRAMQNGDVNAALRVLEGAARTEEKLYWRYEVGEGQHMCDLFWSDGRSQQDYQVFGDVLAFDATYGRNKYNLPVIVFSGVNHHNQTCVFATAMVSCESIASYVWVLRKLLECMGGKAPTAVITDGDRSMRVAIQEVFPNAHHRLCGWHLLKNATVNVCKPRFTSLFRHCMLADIEVAEFELLWDAMLEECGVRELEWVKDMYEKKSSWQLLIYGVGFMLGSAQHLGVSHCTQN